MNFPDDQTEIFINEEADCWFERNFSDSEKKDKASDPVYRYLMTQDLVGKKITEIGCADGWRLAELLKSTDCYCTGVEPSEKAVSTGKERYPHPELNLRTGNAAETGLPSDSSDIVIHGFCLYLCDRSELFRVAAETDRILKNGGILIIIDFLPPFPYRNPYNHRPGLFSYKMDYAEMFAWNPAYYREYVETATFSGTERRAVSPDIRTGMTVLRKQTEVAYPDSPFG